MINFERCAVTTTTCPPRPATRQQDDTHPRSLRTMHRSAPLTPTIQKTKYTSPFATCKPTRAPQRESRSIPAKRCQTRNCPTICDLCPCVQHMAPPLPTTKQNRNLIDTVFHSMSSIILIQDRRSCPSESTDSGRTCPNRHGTSKTLDPPDDRSTKNSNMLATNQRHNGAP